MMGNFLLKKITVKEITQNVSTIKQSKKTKFTTQTREIAFMNNKVSQMMTKDISLNSDL